MKGNAFQLEYKTNFVVMVLSTLEMPIAKQKLHQE